MAERIGRMRTLQCERLRAKHSEYDRGHLNYQVDVNGALAELIFADYLNCQGVEYTTTILDRGSDEFDFHVKGDYFIDVKYVSSRELRVNRKAHYKKKVTHYVFIEPIGNYTANYYRVPYEMVTNWKVKESYTPFFYLEL
jgi:hypothetical protein